jgi:hypothetical protein
MPVVFKDKALFNEQSSSRKGQLHELLIVSQEIVLQCKSHFTVRQDSGNTD